MSPSAALRLVGETRYAVYTATFASLASLVFGLSLNRCLRYAALRGVHRRSFQRTCLVGFLVMSSLLLLTSLDHLGYYGILPYGLVNLVLCLCYAYLFAIGILFVMQLLFMLSASGLTSLSLSSIRKLGTSLVVLESFAWVFCGLMESLEVGGAGSETAWLAGQELFSATVLLLLFTIQMWAVRAAQHFLARTGSTRSRHINSLLCYSRTMAVVALLCVGAQVRQAYKHIVVGGGWEDDPPPGMTDTQACSFMISRTWGAILCFCGLFTGLRLVWSVRGASFGLNSLRNSVDDSDLDCSDVSPPSASVRQRIDEYGPGALREAREAIAQSQERSLDPQFFGFGTSSKLFASHPLFAAGTSVADSLLANDFGDRE